MDPLEEASSEDTSEERLVELLDEFGTSSDVGYACMANPSMPKEDLGLYMSRGFVGAWNNTMALLLIYDSEAEDESLIQWQQGAARALEKSVRRDETKPVLTDMASGLVEHVLARWVSTSPPVSDILRFVETLCVAAGPRSTLHRQAVMMACSMVRGMDLNPEEHRMVQKIEAWAMGGDDERVYVWQYASTWERKNGTSADNVRSNAIKFVRVLCDLSFLYEDSQQHCLLWSCIRRVHDISFSSQSLSNIESIEEIFEKTVSFASSHLSKTMLPWRFSWLTQQS